MNISSVSQNYSPGQPTSGQNAGADAKIRSLEQELQKLESEKQKAVRNKDDEKKEKLEKQIQEIRKQIQLKRQENKKSQKAEPDAPPQEGEKLSDAGRHIDALA